MIWGGRGAVLCSVAFCWVAHGVRRDDWRCTWAGDVFLSGHTSRDQPGFRVAVGCPVGVDAGDDVKRGIDRRSANRGGGYRGAGCAAAGQRRGGGGLGVAPRLVGCRGAGCADAIGRRGGKGLRPRGLGWRRCCLSQCRGQAMAAGATLGRNIIVAYPRMIGRSWRIVSLTAFWRINRSYPPTGVLWMWPLQSG